MVVSLFAVSRARAGDAEPASPAAPPADGEAQPAGVIPGSNEPQETLREHARSLGYAGVRAYAAGDYAAASEQLEQSFGLLPVPSLGLWSARALVKLQRFVDAEQRYREVAKMRVDADAPPVQQAALETAKSELVELLPRIPTLRIQITGAQLEQVSITLDGKELPRDRWSRGEPVDPGAHHLIGTHLGEQSALEIAALEGRESEVLIRFATPEPTAAPAPPLLSTPVMPLADAQNTGPNPWKLGGWLSVGAGAGGLALGTIAYFVARSEYQNMKASGACQDHICNPGDSLDRYDTWRHVAIASWIAGGLLSAGGVTVLLLEPRLSQTDEVAARGEVGVRLGWSSVSLEGRF